jgi:hypothetical protein
MNRYLVGSFSILDQRLCVLGSRFALQSITAYDRHLDRGALTMLRAGTTPEGADWGGKVCVDSRIVS